MNNPQVVKCPECGKRITHNNMNLHMRKHPEVGTDDAEVFYLTPDTSKVVEAVSGKRPSQAKAIVAQMENELKNKRMSLPPQENDNKSKLKNKQASLPLKKNNNESE